MRLGGTPQGFAVSLPGPGLGLHGGFAEWLGNFGQEVIAVKSMKTRIAAAATILGLGGLAGLALSAGRQKPSQPVAAKPLVRTKVIRRTIHVTKHAKPKQPAGGPVAAHGSATGSTGSASYAIARRRDDLERRGGLRPPAPTRRPS